jgi:hypothetical protein
VKRSFFDSGWSAICAGNFSSRPPAITWFIVSIIIYTIKNNIGRISSRHIFKEIFKFSPSLANLNTPLSVVVILGMRKKIAANLHILPRLIFWRIALVVFNCTDIVSMVKGLIFSPYPSTFNTVYV